MPQVQMFGRLSRGEPQFRAWMEQELGQVNKVLVRMGDETQLRVAQGRAQMLLDIIDHLDECGRSSSA